MEKCLRVQESTTLKALKMGFVSLARKYYVPGLSHHSAK